MTLRIFSIVISVLLLSSCSKDDSEIFVETEFQIYLDRFIAEAEQREIEIDVSKLSIVRESLQDGNCGFAFRDYNETGNQRVIIADRPSCWENLSDYEKEYLIFHELGHAMLGRIHREGKFPDGSPASIMCAQICAGQLNQLDMIVSNRLKKYLIDQLFDEFIDPPAWLFKSDPSVLYQEDIGNNLSNWSSSTTCEGYTFGQPNAMEENSGLSISSSEISDCSEGASWSLSIDNSEIKELSFVKATVKLDLDAVEGFGPSVQLFTFGIEGTESISVNFANTLNLLHKINGTQKDLELIVTLPDYNPATDDFSLILSLNTESKGTVKFKEVLVEVFEPNI